MADPQGFEPHSVEPKSTVIPLDHGPLLTLNIKGFSPPFLPLTGSVLHSKLYTQSFLATAPIRCRSALDAGVHGSEGLPTRLMTVNLRCLAVCFQRHPSITGGAATPFRVYLDCFIMPENSQNGLVQREGIEPSTSSVSVKNSNR